MQQQRLMPLTRAKTASRTRAGCAADSSSLEDMSSVYAITCMRSQYDKGGSLIASSQQQLPAKDALPDEYAAVQTNPAWDPVALQTAAAAAATKLGLPSAATAPPGDSTQRHSQDGSSSDSGSSSSDGSSMGAANKQGRQHQLPKFGVLMLVHEKGVAAAEAWQDWEAMHGGKAIVCVHLKAGVSLTSGSQQLPGADFITSRQLPSHIASHWGCISLTAAILSAAADMLQAHPHSLQHIAVVSGQDVPVGHVPLRDLRSGLSLFGRFQFGLQFDAAAGRVATALLKQQLGMSECDAKAWGDALVFHHTWMVLDRQLPAVLLALISKQQEILRVGAVISPRFMQPDAAVAADEFLLVTAALRFGFVVSKVVQKKLQPYMAALRRQHRQQASATEGHCKRKQETARRLVDWRPAGSRLKLPRLSVLSSSLSSPPSQLQPAVDGDAASHAAAVGGVVAASMRILRSSSTGSSTGSSSGSSVRTLVSAMSGRSRSTEPSGQGVVGSLDTASDDSSSSSSVMCDGTEGVLLDCCPTLVLFHPTETRHPHEWRSFGQRLLVDVNSDSPGPHRLTLLEALSLSAPNAALFFRKVAPTWARKGSSAQLTACLRLLWEGKHLPACVQEVQL